LNRPALGNQALDVIARRQVDALGKFFDVESNDVFYVRSLRFDNGSHQADFKRVDIRGISIVTPAAAVNRLAV
jgi:hypothetical protein